MSDIEESRCAELVDLAGRLGASQAGVIDTAAIRIEDALANLCREPQCENYGLGAGCPPHVAGPSGFRLLLRDFTRALVFKLEVPSQSLFSSERQDIFRLLYEIAAAVERAAVQSGYGRARGFAGGSCKRLFCGEHPACRVLSEGGACRHPERARPSMSGFGINVSKLMHAAGWTMHRAAPESTMQLATVCGLVLLG